MEASEQSGGVWYFCLLPGFGSFGGLLTHFLRVAPEVLALGWGKLLTQTYPISDWDELGPKRQA